MQYYVVQDVVTGEILPGLPTPYLIDGCSRAGRLNAYLNDGIWYAQAPGYTSEDGNYTTVRVIRNPEDTYLD